MPGLTQPGELADAGAQPARWSPFGAYLPGGDPGALPAVAEHRAAVQDEASQLAVLALTRADTGDQDRAWLDLCAGPGGKARLLAGIAAERGAVLVAADAHEHRARLAGEAVRPVGSARAVTADGTAPAWRPAAFDRVLADVPCSGLGSLRRRPEARWRRREADIATLTQLQRGLLISAIEATRPGGVLAYVTCSPHLAETRGVLAEVLASRAGSGGPGLPGAARRGSWAALPGTGFAVRPVLAAPARHGRDLRGHPAPARHKPLSLKAGGRSRGTLPRGPGSVRGVFARRWLR